MIYIFFTEKKLRIKQLFKYSSIILTSSLIELVDGGVSVKFLV